MGISDFHAHSPQQTFDGGAVASENRGATFDEHGCCCQYARGAKAHQQNKRVGCAVRYIHNPTCKPRPVAQDAHDVQKAAVKVVEHEAVDADKAHCARWGHNFYEQCSHDDAQYGVNYGEREEMVVAGDENHVVGAEQGTVSKGKGEIEQSGNEERGDAGLEDAGDGGFVEAVEEAKSEKEIDDEGAVEPIGQGLEPTGFYDASCRER